MKIKKYKNFFSDVSLNIFSNILVLGIVQLLIFPLLSKDLGAEKFGIAIALYGFSNVIVSSLGGSMNNMRLLFDEKVKEKGNFSVLLILILIIAFLCSYILNFVYGEGMDSIEKTLIILFTLLGTIRNYANSYFRLNLEYKKVIYTNLILILGYSIGTIFWLYTSLWGIVFFVGELMACYYLVKATPILKEKPKKTIEFSNLYNEYKNLATSNVISTSLNYLDRFLITPVLGSQNLSIYYSVSIISKMISMIITPTTNVFLSYLNKFRSNNLKRHILLVSIISVAFVIPLFFIMNFISPYIVNILYPQFSKVANQYIWVVTLASCFLILGSILQPYLLKFCDMKYQMYIHLVYGIIYLMSAYILSQEYGLMGFCFSTVISFLIKWLLMLYVCLKHSTINKKVVL